MRSLLNDPARREAAAQRALDRYPEHTTEGQLIRKVMNDPEFALVDAAKAEQVIARQTRTIIELHADYLLWAEAVTGHATPGQVMRSAHRKLATLPIWGRPIVIGPIRNRGFVWRK